MANGAGLEAGPEPSAPEPRRLQEEATWVARVFPIMQPLPGLISATGAFVGHCQEMLHHTLHKDTSASFLIMRLEIWAGTEQQLAMRKTILLFIS